MHRPYHHISIPRFSSLILNDIASRLFRDLVALGRAPKARLEALRPSSCLAAVLLHTPCEQYRNEGQYLLPQLMIRFERMGELTSPGNPPVCGPHLAHRGFCLLGSFIGDLVGCALMMLGRTILKECSHLRLCLARRQHWGHWLLALPLLQHQLRQFEHLRRRPEQRHRWRRRHRRVVVE
jgi:hypothetical protein